MNLLRVLGVGAISLLAIGGWKFMGSLRRRGAMPSKEETLAVLEAIRVEFYPVLVRIADFVARELVPRGISPDQNEKFVMQNPEIKSEIEAANKKVYVSFSEEDIKEAMDELYREDGDIAKQKSEFREEYKRSLLGVRPEHKMIASRKVSKKLVLEVAREILEGSFYSRQTS
jgi:ribosomal protein S20